MGALTGTSRISILLADDHKMFMDLWSMILSNDDRFYVCGEAPDGSHAVELAKAKRPNIVLLYINMPHLDGFEATRLIRKFSPGSKIIGLSMYTQPAYAKKLIAMGARGYITKNSAADELMNAVIQVWEGRQYICEEIHAIIRQESQISKPAGITPFLSERELEIIGLVKNGLTSRQVGEKLGISIKTIEVHRNRIFKKLKIKKLAELLNFTHSNSI